MTKKEQVMDLWRKNFQDSEEFIRFYFERKYSDENSLVYEENGKALSALLMLPYPMTWSGTLLTTSYISGACTLQEARNHGLMSMLLQEAFLEMHKRNIALSTLIPANDRLFQYYGHLGYAAVFSYSTTSYAVPPAQAMPSDPFFSPEHFDAEFAQQHYPFFRDTLMQKNCCVQHTEEDYLAIVEETYLSGGRLLVCASEDRQSTTGWALAVPEADTLYVKEMLYRSQQEQATLLHALFSIFHAPSVTCRQFPGQSGQNRYGMARIIDVQYMLSHLAAQNPDLSLRLKVYDPQLPANNGIFTLAAGECISSGHLNRPADIETDIPSLTKALLGYQPDQLPQPLNGLSENQYPYMNLMLD